MVEQRDCGTQGCGRGGGREILRPAARSSPAEVRLGALPLLALRRDLLLQPIEPRVADLVAPRLRAAPGEVRLARRPARLHGGGELRGRALEESRHGTDGCGAGQVEADEGE